MDKTQLKIEFLNAIMNGFSVLDDSEAVDDDDMAVHSKNLIRIADVTVTSILTDLDLHVNFEDLDE